MFDIGWGEFVVIAVVALIVIGPKELPRVLRQVGQAVAKMRRMATEFQSQFMEAMREADLAEIKADVAKLSESARIDAGFNPVQEVKSQLSEAIQGKSIEAKSSEAKSIEAKPVAAEPPAAHEAAALPPVETAPLQTPPAEDFAIRPPPSPVAPGGQDLAPGDKAG